jgi:hypothetical protein
MKKNTVRVVEPQLISDLEAMNLPVAEELRGPKVVESKHDHKKTAKLTLDALRQQLRKEADGKENLNLVIVGRLLLLIGKDMSMLEKAPW